MPRTTVTVEVEAGPARHAVGRRRRGQRADAAGRDSAASSTCSGTVLPQGRRRSKARAARGRPARTGLLRGAGRPSAAAGHAPGSADLAINVDGGARITVVFEGDPLSREAAARAGADRARGLGGRGPARGLGQPHREPPARAGISRRRRRLPADAARRRPGGGVQGAPRSAVPHRTRDLDRRHRRARGRPAGAAANARRGSVRRGRSRLRCRHAGRAVPPPRLHAGSGRADLGARGRQRLAGARRRAADRDRRAANRRRRHHRRRPDCRRRSGAAGGDHLAHRPALLPAAGRGGPRRHVAGAAQPRLLVGHHRCPRGLHPGPVVGRRGVCRRPKARRSSSSTCSWWATSEDQRRDDPARGHAAARRAAELRRAHGEPAAHQRARALPPRSHHPARSRRAEPARPAGHRRRGAGDHRRLRRRPRRRPAAASDRAGRRRHRGVRGRAARVCRVRPAKSLRPQSVHQRVCACQPAHQGVHDQRGRRRGGTERLHPA